MRAPAQVLILENDPLHLERLAAVLRYVKLEPIATNSTDRALRRLAYNHPVLAVLDVDMATDPDSCATVEDLLAHLYQWHGGCFVLVYSAAADEILERKRFEAIHPFAMFAAKQDGTRALLDRIRRMMDVRFGDLHVREGLTVHEPTGEVFLHSVGVLLVLGAALGQEVMLQDTEAKAARRMRAWLEQVGSRVQLYDLGRRCYALHVGANGSITFHVRNQVRSFGW